MTTNSAKKQSNRAIQRTHATYKKKTEISEALHLIQPYINVTTYKFLAHFLHTDGTGVTQMKIAEWCKKVGISLGSYHKVVKPEIETTFSQSLIIKTKAPMKYDVKRKKKVKASEFKSLLPLSVLKHVIRLKESLEEQEERAKFLEQIETIEGPEISQSEIESEIEGEIESIPSIPCESKDEGHFQQQQNNSFRENHLEKKSNNNMALSGFPVIDLSKIDPKTTELLNSYKNFAEWPYYLGDQQKNEQFKTKLTYWVQMAVNKAEADINNLEHQHVIKEAVGTVLCHYDLYDYSEEELTKIMYQSVKNILEAVISGQRQVSATIQPKSKRKIIRTELLPEGFDNGDYWANYEAKLKAESEKEPEMSIDELLKALEIGPQSPKTAMQGI